MPESQGLWIVLFCLGAVLVVLPAPAGSAAQALRNATRRSGLELAVDERDSLVAGPDAERVLFGLLWRTIRAAGVFLAGIALAWVLVLHGPPLSRSTPLSWTAAALLCTGVLGPYLVLRPFLRPLKGSGGWLRRDVGVGDYLGPVRRVLMWLAVASALAIPIGATALARTDAYDSSKIYWQGLVGLPLASLGAVLAVEFGAHRVQDRVSDPSLVYLWDILRARTLRLMAAVVTFGVALAWQLASDGLTGVALIWWLSPEWLDEAVSVADGLSLAFYLGTALLLLLPVGRFRARLWPGLAPGETMRWGDSATP